MAGGVKGGGKKLDSSEVFDGHQWISAKPLPIAVDGLAGATVSNTVFMLGQYFVHM